MKDFFDKYEKIIIISLIIILGFLIGIYLLINPKETKNNPKVENNEISRIVLFGSKTITIEEGKSYVEPGYYAVTKDGEIKKDVEVTGNEIDTNVPGTYYISYTIGNKKETREVIVEEKDKQEEKKEEPISGRITLTLKGESMMVLNKGNEYIEPGYVANDTIDGDITDKVKIKGEVNTEQVGTYKITYEVENSNLEKKEVTRTIVVKSDVIDAKVEVSETGYTNKNVEVKIEVVGDNYSYIKNPDGTITKDKNSSYEIKKNGTYKFIIYDQDNKYIVKEVKINKIDKEEPTGSCKAVIDNGKSKISVSGKDDLSGIKNYVYYGDSEELTDITQASYTHNKEIYTSFVIIYDNAGNNSKITCQVDASKSTQPIDSSISCTATLKEGKTYFKVKGNNIKTYKYNGEYKGSNSTFVLDKYVRSNNFVVITDNYNRQGKVKCKTTLDTLPPIIPSGSKKYQADTKTLKINVIKDGGMYLSYIWAKDPVNQLKKSYTSGKSKLTEYILEDTVKKEDLKNKYILGFNASPPCNNIYYDKWSSKYQLKEPSPLMIQNGKVLVNDPNKSSSLFIYYLDDSNQLRYTNRVNNMTVEERKKVYDEIIASGAKNTMTWRPILVDNYKVADLEDEFVKMESTRKQAICQLDSNNFIIITSENSKAGVTSYSKLASYIQKLGCRVAVEFDAGGSTSLLWKNKGSNDVSRITGGGRQLTSVVYFTE